MTAAGVARGTRRLYNLRLRTCPWLLLALAAAACAPRATTSPGDPALVEPALIDSVQAATAPARPLQVTFDWSMQDRDARFSGKGVVRMAPPYRARLDLFGPRGETFVAAVLDHESLRIVPQGAQSLLPPPAFLWAAIGVFRAPTYGPGVEPAVGTRRTGEGAELSFQAAGERWLFTIGRTGMTQAEWLGPDGGRRTIQLSGGAAHGLPTRGTYRDWREFRELTLSVTAVEEVDAFPADIWMGGER